MNKTLTTILVACIPFAVKAGTWHAISSASPAQAEVRVISSTASETVLSVTTPGFYLAPAGEQAGETKLTVPGMTPVLRKGSPDLPKAVASIIIPDHGSTNVEVVSFGSYTDYQDIFISPSKGSLLRNIDKSSVPFVKGEDYQKDVFFPGSFAELQQPFIVRDFRGQSVWLYPIQYNPVTHVLRVYDEMTVRVTHKNVPGVNELARSRGLSSVDNEYARLYASIFKNDQAMMRYMPLSEDGEMLIIAPAAYMSAMTPYIEWKTKRGIRCTLVDVATIGNDDISIKAYVQAFYGAHNLKYVLLVGDAADVATPSLSGGASDPSYGYLAGSDSYAEVIVGRFSAQSLTDVETQVQRSVDYEKNPTPGGTWYQKAIGMASDQGPGDDGEMDFEHERNIRADLLNFGYTDVDEVYDGTQGLADNPGDPSSSDLIALINDGRSVINYTGHGSQTACATTGFSSSDVWQLVNFGMLPFWWSVGCVHGEFDTGTCIAEALLRAQNANQPTGMVATFMSSINQYWDEPMDAQDEFDSLLTESYVNNTKRTFGGISVNGCMKMNDSYGTTGYEMTDTWHCFGDPSLMIRNNVPTAIVASHAAQVPIGVSQLTVNCNINGAVVTITKGLQILGSAVVSGNIALVNFPALASIDTLDVTATAFNCIPYLSTLLVIPASGPYVVASSSAIQDPSGNNNGMPDYGESVALDVELNNVGLADAQQVTAVLSSTDPYITITSSGAAFGTILAGNTLNLPGAFSFQVSGNVPDQHVATFDLAISDSLGNTWNTPVMKTLNAPALAFRSMTIYDSTGNNNGFLESGETADVTFILANDGHSQSPFGTGSLATTSPYITINTMSASIDTINPSGDYQVSMNVTMAAGLAIGTLFDFTVDATCGAYTAARTFNLSAGEILEDFETGTFNKFPWYQGGNAPWNVTAMMPYQGLWSAQSGFIGNSSTSDLSIDATVLADDTIAFYKLVSSEATYDFLIFYIDGVVKGQWSGNIPWGRVAYPVSTGQHTFTWSYDKDNWLSAGSDLAMIDNVRFPSMVMPTAVHDLNPTGTFRLFPNPVGNRASLEINLEKTSKVDIRLFSIDGSLVRVISDGATLKAGAQTVSFPSDNLAKGVYALQIIADGKVSTLKLVK